MHGKSVWRVALGVASLLWLSGCIGSSGSGGGKSNSVERVSYDGGNTDEAVLSADNAERMTVALFKAADGADRTNDASSASASEQRARESIQLFCPNGGNVQHTSIADTDTYTAMEQRYNDCVWDNDVRWDGWLYYEVEHTDTRYVMAFTYDNLTVTYGTDTRVLDGSWVWECTGIDNSVLENCRVLSIYDSGTTVVRIDRAHWSVQRDAEQRITSINGEICDYREGCVVLSTNPDLAYDGACGNGMPSAGALWVESSAGASQSTGWLKMEFFANCEAEITGVDNSGGAIGPVRITADGWAAY